MSFLADAHKPPVAHRDLSSSNVLVRADGTCVLCDFGCATVLHSFSRHPRQSCTNMSVRRAGGTTHSCQFIGQQNHKTYPLKQVKQRGTSTMATSKTYKTVTLPFYWSAGLYAVGHTALHVPRDPGRLGQPHQHQLPHARGHLCFGTAAVGDLDALHGFISR